MANPEHVEIVKQGAEAIAEWRRYCPAERLDFSRANLCRFELSEFNLSEADLWMADLSGADLSGADLSGADLSGADLSGADLKKANLVTTNLCEANLSSDCLELQVVMRFSFQIVLSRIMTLRMLTSFLMQAMRATSFGFPLATRRS